MTKWIVGVPCWGDRCIDVFLAAGLPSLKQALAGVGHPIKFVLHTDRPDRLARAFAGMEAEFRRPPEGQGTYERFAAAHNEALSTAAAGDRVSLLCADTIYSADAFAACERRFRHGYEAIVAAGPRTDGPILPPVSAPPRALLAWAMQYRHALTEDCFWGRGHTQIPSFVFFERDDNIVLRAFHLHPIAFVKRDWTGFASTVDDGLPTLFERDKIHVVTDPDEMSFIEISPPERRSPQLPHALTIDGVVNWARRRALPVHWWFASHRIVMRGDPATVDDSEWETIARSPSAPSWAAAAYRGDFTASPRPTAA